MALLIAPLFTAGIVLGGIQNANAGTIGDSNPPAYRGAENSIHFEWFGDSLPTSVFNERVPPDVFVLGPSSFSLFDLTQFGLPAQGSLDTCGLIFAVCQVTIPNFDDGLERKFFRVQVSYTGTPPTVTSMLVLNPDFSVAPCVLQNRSDDPGYYFEDWECVPNPIVETYSINALQAEVTQIVIDTISFDGAVPPDPPEDDIDVDIDIKPGSDPNSINTRSMGVVPVAILGSDTFDVTDVDVTTLMFGGASPAHDLSDSDTYDEHIQDVNDDGFDDLVSHYKQKETGIACGDTAAQITGALNDGTLLIGEDSVNPKCKP